MQEKTINHWTLLNDHPEWLTSISIIEVKNGFWLHFSKASGETYSMFLKNMRSLKINIFKMITNESVKLKINDQLNYQDQFSEHSKAMALYTGASWSYILRRYNLIYGIARTYGFENFQTVGLAAVTIEIGLTDMQISKVLFIWNQDLPGPLENPLKSIYDKFLSHNPKKPLPIEYSPIDEADPTLDWKVRLKFIENWERINDVVNYRSE